MEQETSNTNHSVACCVVSLKTTCRPQQSPIARLPGNSGLGVRPVWDLGPLASGKTTNPPVLPLFLL